ncbi:hypothetical protein FE782_27985 [Paenibacillus antri]|uniref:Uncharacterized protein n=1 Tax=Paenibacillus antri TaxID=2582848 RepID=A0A5R9FY56_9BACL|nr:hypothetical protein [Paenibacillus antri]TLS48982.1 hypothetical protein FE782_27985 [Paenibacillus antri]
MKNNRDIVIVVVTRARLRRFLAIDMAGSTAVYYALFLPFHSQWAASAGSFLGALALNRLFRGGAARARKRSEAPTPAE